MRTRPALTLLATALTAVTSGLLVAPPTQAAPPGAPTHVRTTVQLTPNGGYRVAVAGRARVGAKVVLQDRFDEHDNWVTQRRTTVGRSGAFRLAENPRSANGSFRVCVVRPGKDACTNGGVQHVVKRTGTIRLTSRAAQVVPAETTVIATGRVSKILRGLPLSFSYLDPASHRWVRPSRLEVDLAVDGAQFEVRLPFESRGLVSKQGLRLRVVAKGDRWRRTVTQEWSTNSYTRQPLTSFPVASGSLLTGRIVYGFLIGAPVSSDAVSPAGTAPLNSVTLTVPAGCGRVQAGVARDAMASDQSGSFTAAVARNGVTAWTYDSANPGPAGSNRFSVDVTGGDTLTLTSSYDAARPELRAWFVTPFDPYVPIDRLPFALCSAP